MTENNYACKDNLWAHCGALGDALRRASEAERKVEELEAKSAEAQEMLEYYRRHQALDDCWDDED